MPPLSAATPSGVVLPPEETTLFHMRQQRQPLTECRTVMFRVMRHPPRLPETVPHRRAVPASATQPCQRHHSACSRASTPEPRPRSRLRLPQAAGPDRGDNPVIAPLKPELKE
ncbi:MAG: hypothetical protein ACLTBV_16315 [Enterocloster bolteae]